MISGKFLTLGRHHFLGVRGKDALEERTVRAVAGDEGGFAGVTTLERRALAVESHAALLLFLAVTFVAALCEQGLHLALEIDLSLRAREDGRAQR